MSTDVEIHIFGTVADPEKIWDLALAASDEGSVNWHESFEPSEFVEMLRQAAEKGTAVTITRGDTKNLFEAVTSACWEAELSYVMHYGRSGADFFTSGTAWTPGMAKEREFSLSEKGVTVELADLRRAAANGIDHVNALIERLSARAAIGKIELAPDFDAKFTEFEDSELAPGM